MKYSIEYSHPAEIDIISAAVWWSENRSSVEAMKWLDAIESKIRTLEEDPHRFPIAPESDSCSVQLRQMLFGVGQRITHRIVFAVTDSKVRIVRVRHVAQSRLLPDDLT